MIFVDQQMRGIGTVKIVELPVGSHQVFVQMSGVGRRYEIDIKADEDTVLDILPDIHKLMWVSDQRIWFQFITETERALGPRYSGAAVRDWKTRRARYNELSKTIDCTPDPRS